MDSITPPPVPVPIQANPISSFSSSTKLPIKRKTPNSNTTTTLILTTTADDDVTTTTNPPFKFHRIWSEHDEIRLLQSLLHSSYTGLSFPRDLGIFYNQFSDGMSQPYSKSQLSEKLRRLRKKFRVISSRISKGLDPSLLSHQDLALYDLSKQLWDPNHPPLPFSGTGNCKSVDDDRKSNIPAPSSSTAVLALPSVVQKPYGNKSNDFDVKVKLAGNEVKVKDFGGELSDGIVRFVTRTIGEVVDESLKEVRRRIEVEKRLSFEKEIGFEKRWRDQSVAEFDVLAKRLKLILEGSKLVSK